MTSSQQRAALQRQIWQIANDVRGAVDGWDFKQYVLGTLFYRFIISLGLRLGLAPTDLKMATGLMVILALGIPAFKKAREGKIHLRGV